MSHGHNESAVRLAALAGDAQIALDKVARGEADALEGWLAYGAALNEGRALFAGDREFGQWIAEMCSSNLDVHPGEQQAAMWAAAHADQFAEARDAGNARTVRGIHAKWKEIEAERQAEAHRAEAERVAAERRADAEAAAKAVETSRAAAEANPTPEAKAAVAKGEAISAARKEDLVSATAAIPDPHAAERRKLAKLTREALEDDLIGLRADLADERERRKKAEAENKTLKGRLDDLLADDRNEVIRRMQRELAHAQSERWRQQDETRRAMAQVHGLKKRVAELERMGVAL